MADEHHISVETTDLIQPNQDKVLKIKTVIEGLGHPELANELQQYLNWDRNRQTHEGMTRFAEKKDIGALEKHLLKRIQFGTAGLRGPMGTGVCSMNELVVIQTSQGLMRYLEDSNGDVLSSGGIVVAFDGRHNSRRFAELTTAAFINNGYTVHLFSNMCPTPFVPFAVRKLKCAAGIMVTASHNPKEDNGYKVYWDNGAQIIPPHDKGIQTFIMLNLTPWENAWTLDTHSKNIRDPFSKIHQWYFEELAGTSMSASAFGASDIIFTYTPMHGVGYRFMTAAFAATVSKTLHPVKEQKDPDPDFPTVKFPNPEEGKSALNLAIATANKLNSTLILANDPDADRLAVAEKLPNGEWKIFNGNELGTLLAAWILECFLQDHDRKSLSNCYMLSSTVSSKILQTMAEKEGFNFVETLTGFKWMGNEADALVKAGKTVLFAFEEAIGFMCGTQVLDKDGISAGIRIAELAMDLKIKHKRSLNDQLVQIYNKYGYHLTCNSYFICYEQSTISKIFETIRKFHEYSIFNGYPFELMSGQYKVKRIRDLTTGYDSGEQDRRARLPISRSSQMVTFFFDQGLEVTLRTSGTEPKIKYYSELRAAPVPEGPDAYKKALDDAVTWMMKEWIKPDKWHLKSPPTDD